MRKLRIGVLTKKRGNFVLQEKFAGPAAVVDQTAAEVGHHEQALQDAGYEVIRIPWGPEFHHVLQVSAPDLVFNVSSLVEAAILEELEVPFVGSGTTAIAVSLDKSLAKRLWSREQLPTSPFVVARSELDCLPFRSDPPIDFPLFVKPVASRGSAGVSATSIAHNYHELASGVSERLVTIGQPVLIERHLQGREITLGVVGNEHARVLPPLEIVYRQGDATLSYDKKERDDDLFRCPAPLRGEEDKMMRRLALDAYRVLGFRDFGRIDTILTADGPFLLEANAFAGLTCTPAEKPHSYMGFMARAEGHGGRELVSEIVEQALERHQRPRGG